MCQVNIFQAKTEFSKLLALLETETEDEIVIARNGKPVARLVKWNAREAEKRIGVAKGLFTVPVDFNDDDPMISTLFMGAAE